MTLVLDRRYNQRDVPTLPPLEEEDIIQPAGSGSVYDDLILAESNLVAYYKCDETTGGTVADTLRLHDGTLSGGYTLDEWPIPGRNPGGNSIKLDGSSGAITLANAFDLSNGPWSIEAWIKRYNLAMTSDQAIFGTTETGPGGFLISAGSISPVNTISAYSSAYSGPYTTALTDTNDFHHVVVTKWDDTWKIYLDAVEVAGTPGGQTSDTGLIVIGNNPSVGNTFFNGWVASIAVYKKALPLATIEDHYDAGHEMPVS